MKQRSPRPLDAASREIGDAAPGPPSERAGTFVRFSGPRLVAFDLDGTLTFEGRPRDETLAAVARARSLGLRVVLVTGRIGAELRAVFGDVDEHFDALVLENGAEVVCGQRVFTLGSQIDPSLSEVLRTRGVAHRCGNVIVATSSTAEHVVVDEISRLGLECQLMHNRRELMVVPSGVNKGVGLRHAAGDLGLSLHDCVAVGDAENDHSLLSVAELGVAVANAIDSLKQAADVVLDRANGEAAAELLDDLEHAGGPWSRRSRCQVPIGHDSSKQPVQIAARPGNVIITGGSGDGKSYLAGLIAEQLIELEYSVLVVDPEGDHAGLGALGTALVVGGDHPPPPVDTIVDLFQRNDACVVVDLSSLEPEERGRYLVDLPAQIEASRRSRGRPHWVFFDEAHYSVVLHEAVLGSLEPASNGYCLVTWRPELLPRSLVTSCDCVLALTSPSPDDDVVDLVASIASQPRSRIVELLTTQVGHVLVVRRDPSEPPRLARLATRGTAHRRHERKYSTEGAPLDRSFWFRNEHDVATGAVARNLHELESELAHCRRGVLRHHLPRGDLGRWIEDVFRDRDLAVAVRVVEATVQSDSPSAVVDGARLALLDRIAVRRCAHAAVHSSS